MHVWVRARPSCWRKTFVICEWCEQQFRAGSTVLWCRPRQYTKCSLCYSLPKRQPRGSKRGIETSGLDEGSATSKARVLGAEDKRVAEAKAKPLAARTIRESRNAFDFSSVLPPYCVRCKFRAWPGSYSNAGKYHCADAKCNNGHPPEWLPQCHRCGVRTFDGQWRGTNMIAQNKGFCCRSCWIEGCSDSEREGWVRWFTHRQNCFGLAFPENPEDWKLQRQPNA